MRLYEFTNPTKYLPPGTDAADLLKQSKNIETADAADIADPHLKKRPETKKPMHTR
jgi:hypothetical protein